MSRELALERSKEQQRRIKAENDMTTKHTPGPWVAGQLEDNDCCDVKTECGYYIATCHDCVGGERNADANARLIASAPELLKWLKFAAKLLRPTCGHTWQFEQMEAAIKKAEGETP